MPSARRLGCTFVVERVNFPIVGICLVHRDAGRSRNPPEDRHFRSNARSCMGLFIYCSKSLPAAAAYRFLSYPIINGTKHLITSMCAREVSRTTLVIVRPHPRSPSHPCIGMDWTTELLGFRATTPKSPFKRSTAKGHCQWLKPNAPRHACVFNFSQVRDSISRHDKVTIANMDEESWGSQNW